MQSGRYLPGFGQRVYSYSYRRRVLVIPMSASGAGAGPADDDSDETEGEEEQEIDWEAWQRDAITGLRRVRRLLPTPEELAEWGEDNWPLDMRRFAKMMRAAVAELNAVTLETRLAAVLMSRTKEGDRVRRLMVKLWKIMRRVINKNRGEKPSAGKRVRSSDLVRAEENMEAIRANLLWAYQDLVDSNGTELQPEDLLRELRAILKRVVAAVTQRALEQYNDDNDPPAWVRQIRLQLRTQTAAEQQRILAWKALKQERERKAAMAAVRRNVAVRALQREIANLEEELSPSSPASPARTERNTDSPAPTEPAQKESEDSDATDVDDYQAGPSAPAGPSVGGFRLPKQKR